MSLSCRSVWTAIFLLAYWLTLLMVKENVGGIVRDVVNVSGIDINRNLSTSTYLVSGLVTDDGTRCDGDAQYLRAFREGECYQSTVGTYQTIFLPRSLLYQSRLVSAQVSSIRLALVNNDLFPVVDEISAMCSYLGIDYQLISLNKPRSEFAKLFLNGIKVYFSVALVTDGSYNGCATEWGQHLDQGSDDSGFFLRYSSCTRYISIGFFARSRFIHLSYSSMCFRQIFRPRTPASSSDAPVCFDSLEKHSKNLAEGFAHSLGARGKWSERRAGTSDII